MPEFQFENPSLEKISHSLIRMNQKLDAFIFKLFFFFHHENRRLAMQDSTVSRPEMTYENPISLRNFSELETPVLDSEGFLREKDEPKINLGIYSRKPVTITESADLRKVQRDYRSLEEKMDALMGRIDEDMRRRNQENEKRDRKWEETTKRWEKEREETTRRWELERAETRRENQAIINNLRAENGFLIKENDELKEELQEKNEIIERLENKSGSLSDSDNESDNEEIKVSASAPELGWKKTKTLPAGAKWIDRNTFLGIRHTFSDLKHTKEGKEYSFRIGAHYGNIKEVENYIKKNKDAVNTRMWPDALTSTLLSCEDKTPLMVAARQGHLKIVNLLLENGAHVNYLDRHRLTALDYAEMNKHHEIAIILKENGAENGRYLKDIFENSNSNSSSAPVLR
ncbi:MAG TPA: ankyrin repeat domain-containing protein [Waddliaceae bacterium]